MKISCGIPLFLLSALFMFCFAGDSARGDFIIHTVKKGESVSLICIDYYGYYSKELGAAFHKDNPGVKDINVIIAGQILRFRPPRTAQAKTAAPSSPDDSLFVKKVSAQQGVVTCVEGTVTLVRKGLRSSEPLGVNTIVVPGDRIITSPNGRAEIIVNRETVVRLREKTTMIIEAYRNPGKTRGKTRLSFPAGAIWTKMKKFQDRFSRFELELPTATAGVHGTVYQTSVNADSSAEVKVFSGEVSVKGRNGGPAGVAQGKGPRKEISGPVEVQGPSEVDLETWVRIVRSMQKIAIDKHGKASAPKPFSWDTTSSWEAWNRERDDRIGEMFGEKAR